MNEKPICDMDDFEMLNALRESVFKAAPLLRKAGEHDLSDRLCLLTGCAIGIALKYKPKLEAAP